MGTTVNREVTNTKAQKCKMCGTNREDPCLWDLMGQQRRQKQTQQAPEYPLSALCEHWERSPKVGSHTLVRGRAQKMQGGTKQDPQDLT
jgi:hypothetical protein